MDGESRFRRLAPAIGLIFLSPLVGEFLLGSSPIQYLPYALVLLVPLYGGGALLIRELARRSGRGYPTVVLLGAAYGVIEAGLLDQSMFNPDFLEPANGGKSPASPLAVSVNNALGYVTGHAVWSIVIPVAFIELMAPPEKSESPWLGKVGLAASAVLYLTGCAIVFSFIYAEHRFLASPAQLAGAAAAAVVLIFLAFKAGTENGGPRQDGGKELKPRLLGTGSFLASGGFVSRPENWAGFAAGIILLIAAWFLLRRWSRRSWWSKRHRFALVSGALMTYAWLGFVVTHMLWPDDRIAWFGNALFASAAIALIAWISRRVKRDEKRKI